MAGITVFETYEQAIPTLDTLLKDNTDVRMRIGKIGKMKEIEYRQQTGYDDRLREQQKSDPDHFDLSLFALPEDERQKVRADVGKGFELTCAVGLSAYNGTYRFSADVIKPDWPIPKEDHYTTIKELVAGVKRYLPQEDTHYGATLTPFVYTVAKELTFGDEEKQSLQENINHLEILDEEGLKISALMDEFGDRDELLGMCSAMLASADIPVRGLNAEERAEFERLFYSQ
ncbi:MAG: hypothetical protein Q8R53_03465 [Nanoarchaeota archaeon]|nr:hypothetical protein [Nanoarchaeota archaeon]